MNGIKRGILDFVSASAIVLTVVFCAAMLTNAGLFEDALVYNENKTEIELFGVGIKLDERAVFVSEKLLDFNDVVFFRGFADAVRAVRKYAFDFLSDILTVMFTLARRLTGAE